SLLPLTFEDSRLGDSMVLKDKALRHAERKIKRLESTLRESAEALPAGIIVIDRENRVQWSNQKAAVFVGVRDPEDIGQPIDNLLRNPVFSDMLNRKPKTLDSVEDIQITSPINEQVELRVTLNRYAKRLRLITIEDVSDFQRINRMRQNFIGNASHELRTPLTVIRGYLDEMLEEFEQDSEWLLPLREIDKQTYRMQDILQDMLVLSRLESQTRLASSEAVDFVNLVTQAVIDLDQASSHSHAIDISLPQKLLLAGNESELYSIVSNLVKNALHYSPAGSKITISWIYDSAKQAGSLTVSDQGIGIPEESISHLTERFYRVDDARSREMGGTGLGLAIVKHALHRHEAVLDIKSELGKGSSFICEFPTQRIIEH
ncbi:MAG: phosphate regulon sensor histidine kinase PhoR, partial [Gammaproteobacteria bacterium]|nr:phosphate regulon sensor histidine kinase PhoR [Gammaproteobacteria bacterium]